MAIQPQAILFDLDNTLTNRRASVSQFARRFYMYFRAQHQMTRVDDLIPIIHNADDGGYRPLDERWRMLQRWIPWKSQPSTNELRDYWYTELGRCAIGVEGLHEVLSEFHSKHIKLGIITNGPESLQNLTIDTLNIRQYLDTAIVSESVGMRKPSAEIYQIALDEINLTADEVWFVGDNPATDILGAFQFGMTTVWIQGHHDWIDDTFQPDYTVGHIREILSLI